MAYTAQQGANLIIQSLGKLGYPTDGYDTSTPEGVDNVFNTVGAFPPSMLNNILEQVNIVLVFNNYKVMFDSSENPTRRFWRDFINYGGGVEDIFHKIIEAEDGYWAEDFANLSDEDYRNLSAEVAADLVSFKKEDVAKKFHTEMDKFRIKLSRSDLEIAKVFTPTGFVNYVDAQMANMQTSAEVKLQSIAIDQIRKVVNDNRIVYRGGYNVNTPNGVTSFVEDIKAIFDGMTENVSDMFNYSGVTQKSKKDDMYLVTTPELKERIRTRGYANAYNLKEYEADNRWLTLPYGTDLGEDVNGNKVLALLVDRKTIVLALRYWQMLPFRVNNTDYTNYFLKVMLVKGYNEFFNAVAFTGEDIGNFTDGERFATVIVKYSEGDALYGASEVVKNVIANGKRLDFVQYDSDAQVDIGTIRNVAQIPSGSFVEIEEEIEQGDNAYYGISEIKINGVVIFERESADMQPTPYDNYDYYVNDSLEITVGQVGVPI